MPEKELRWSSKCKSKENDAVLHVSVQVDRGVIASCLSSFPFTSVWIPHTQMACRIRACTFTLITARSSYQLTLRYRDSTPSSQPNATRCVHGWDSSSMRYCTFTFTIAVAVITCQWQTVSRCRHFRTWLEQELTDACFSVFLV